VPISYSGELLSTLLHVSLIPTSHNRRSASQLQRSATEHSSTFPQATTGLVPISYRRALLSTLLHASFPQATTGLVPMSYRRALLSTLLHVSLIPTSYNRPSTCQLQRSATEHSSTCKSHSHKLQQAQYLPVTEEHYWALFYMKVLFPQATTGLVPISYRRALLSTLLRATFPHATTGLVPVSFIGAILSTLLNVSLIPTSHNRPSAYQLQRSATEHSSTCKSHSHKPLQA
jgi:GTP-sensing pleiotropic transcriptional regulator CodY